MSSKRIPPTLNEDLLKLTFPQIGGLNDIRIQESEAGIFLNEIFNQGVSGVIYKNIKDHKIEHNFPSSIIDALEEEYLSVTGRNLIFQELLKASCARFEENQLECLVIRGTVFFDELYPTLGMRPIIDMDFVFHPSDFVKAQKELIDLGYACHAYYPYFYFKDDIYIDVHLDAINYWRIQGWPNIIRLSNPTILEQAQPYKAYRYIKQLNNYDTLIHCCEHLVRHCFNRLIWFVDIAYLIDRKEDFHYEGFISRLREHNHYKSVLYVLEFFHAQRILNVPEEVLKECQFQAQLGYIERKSLGQLVRNKRLDLPGDILSWLAIPSLSKKWVVLYNGIFISRNKFPRSNERLTVWTYVVRFCKLLKMSMLRILSLFRS